MENAIGGLLLKLQDKFRVGEVISLPSGSSKLDGECTVEEISYIATKLRRSDNSLLVVPNHTFTQGEIVNWSRTPYRLFRTSFTVPVTNLKELITIVNNIRGKLVELKDIEKQERNLIVAATGFRESKVVIEIEAHLSTTSEVRSGEIKTEIINTINSVLGDIK
jgi:small-conductance mechanosensitive channel